MRKSTLVGLTLLLLSIAGCKVSCTTANISSFKFSKDEKGTVQTKEFAPGDTVYTIANVSNNPSKVTLKFSFFAEKVEGVEENKHFTDGDFSIEVSGNNYAVYHLHQDGGFRAGRYRVEVAMLYNGEQKDKKSDTFTVTGGGSSGAPPSPAETKSPKDEATPAEDDGNDNESENSSGPHGEH